MILFYDTETSGLPNKRQLHNLDVQPHIMQLAFSLYDDERRPVLEVSTYLTIPDHASISPEALTTHGIERKKANQYGMNPDAALRLLGWAARKAELAVAHNEKFDLQLLEFAALRLSTKSPLAEIKTLCTMEATIGIIKMPPTEAMIKWGHGDKFKPPKLTECWTHFFGEELSGAHDALVDTRGCARVYYHLLDNGLIEP
jgi:DNA polymerase III subunit epsilon